MNQLRKYDTLVFFLFILPWIIGFTVFFLVPFGTSIFYAFTDAKLPGAVNYQFIGLANFVEMLSDPIFSKSLFNTMFFVIIGVPIVCAGMLLLAMLLNFKVKGIALYRTFYYLPTLVPIVATVIIWRLVFNSEFGILNAVLGMFGADKIDWLGGEHTIKPVIILLQVWISGSGVLIFLAALKNVPRHLYEAAELDGASGVRRFFSITLPMISPSILFVVIIQTMYNFQMFTEAMLLSKGGPNYASYTFVYNIYKSAFTDLKFSMAMAQSLFLFVLIALVTAALMKLSNRYVYYEAEN
ncbi:carbohydrate ABC transporter permease [Paenibacillus macerans]|uniref:Binding--dependent transport system inner membrane component family protein n=1 Tax=Paenibacillus macerans TaxID=44252 RepID=A0A090ZPF0_PAEMA|nr:sugar ABC transporter permease [Paenibacillus macerans]KFN12105.1 binding--dependent transport system inner membrane component family protein [Paenibacillus macerans]MCY7558367.1 sugar ABC transporter permease [Paenibacillus macerans]MEC0150352.1 sugar ABC transporter permease [Paenibacillus macerans]SUA84305.1 binding-protein-dependent transport system inner membrane protein [Paenibacillus macerans]